MSPNHSSLSSPRQGERVPPGTLTYFEVINRQVLWELITDEFEKSGISQAELARRLNWDPARVCTILGAPANYTADTVSAVLFAISGGQPKYLTYYPLSEPPQNYVGPDWLHNQPRGSTELPPRIAPQNRRLLFEEETSVGRITVDTL
jgi:hypothetical protein